MHARRFGSLGNPPDARAFKISRHPPARPDTQTFKASHHPSAAGQPSPANGSSDLRDAAVAAPLINLVTAVSRPENLPRMYRSAAFALSRSTLRAWWIVVVDGPGALPPAV